jgi:hypothetical protein
MSPVRCCTSSVAGRPYRKPGFRRGTGNSTSTPCMVCRAAKRWVSHDADARSDQQYRQRQERIVAFVESGWEHDPAGVAPALMDEVAGAMRMLSARVRPSWPKAWAAFVGNELLGDRRVPSRRADGSAGRRAGGAGVLPRGRARTSRRSGTHSRCGRTQPRLLGYWPLPAAAGNRRSSRQLQQVRANDMSVTVSCMRSTRSFPNRSACSRHDAGALFIGGSETHAAPVHNLDGLRLAKPKRHASVRGPRARAIIRTVTGSKSRKRFSKRCRFATRWRPTPASMPTRKVSTTISARSSWRKCRKKSTVCAGRESLAGLIRPSFRQ